MDVLLQAEKVFEVIGESGRLQNMKQIGAAWNNMIELQDDNGEKLILYRKDSFVTDAMNELMNQLTEYVVIGGSSALIERLRG